MGKRKKIGKSHFQWTTWRMRREIGMKMTVAVQIRICLICVERIQMHLEHFRIINNSNSIRMVVLVAVLATRTIAVPKGVLQMIVVIKWPKKVIHCNQKWWNLDHRIKLKRYDTFIFLFPLLFFRSFSINYQKKLNHTEESPISYHSCLLFNFCKM